VLRRFGAVPLLLGRLVIDETGTELDPIRFKLDDRPLVAAEGGVTTADVPAGVYRLEAWDDAGVRRGEASVTVVAAHQVACAWSGVLFRCDGPEPLDLDEVASLTSRQREEGPAIRMRLERSATAVALSGGPPHLLAEGTLVEQRWIPDLDGGDVDLDDVFPSGQMPGTGDGPTTEWTVSAGSGAWCSVVLDGRTAGLLQVSRSFTVPIAAGRHEVVVRRFLGEVWWRGEIYAPAGQALRCEFAPLDGLFCEEPAPTEPLTGAPR
jgi:hypothetical protein